MTTSGFETRKAVSYKYRSNISEGIDNHRPSVIATKGFCGAFEIDLKEIWSDLRVRIFFRAVRHTL